MNRNVLHNNGISFMMRVRNEENTLEQSIRSLFRLSIPYEIVIVLHLCEDNSEKIAEKLALENSKIRIFKYGVEISRAGYQTLATDNDSNHSIMTYYNWCLQKTTYPWIFKWDGDFICSLPLLVFLNSNTWTTQSTAYKINAINKTSSNSELYLICNIIKYTKQLFWEVPVYNSNTNVITLNKLIYIGHASELDNLKTYWNYKPWYETENSEEAQLVKNRILRLTNDYGKEPSGMARASNHECDAICSNINNTAHEYINFIK